MVDDDGSSLFKQLQLALNCGSRRKRGTVAGRQRLVKNRQVRPKHMIYKHFGEALVCIANNRHMMKSQAKKKKNKLKTEEGK